MNRKIDTLGRIVLPKEMRTQLDIKENDSLNIELQDNKIIITKPDTVDYKKRIDKAIEYLDDWLFNVGGMGACMEYRDIKEILEILKGE